jgi:putative component of membrane protein insertase Oxa1/YidC/SpoIIIJ protein YidD
MIRITVIILFFALSIGAQTDWVKWGKTDFSYEIKQENPHRQYSISGNNIGETALKTLAVSYWFFISDVDGDNCPFSPTCSSFFLQSVKETNIIQGTLMFADRFTRDMDFVDRLSHYPMAKNRHFYDPPSLYTLNTSKINYIPAGELVDK